MSNTIQIAPHGACNIVVEHGQEWAVCDTCGAQWALHGADLEQVSEGDGFCDENEAIGQALVSPSFDRQIKDVAAKLWATHPNNPNRRKP